MNDSKKLTKIILTAVGILIVFRLVSILLPGIIILCFGRPKYGGSTFINIVLFLISVAIIIAVIKLFFSKNDWLVGKIVKSESDDSANLPMTTESAFRLAAFSAGSYVLLLSVNGIFSVFSTYMRFRSMESEGGGFRTTFTGPGSSLGSLLPYAVLLVFAVYFIFGAPHLVRWHVKRSEQLAADIAEDQNVSNETIES